MSEGSGDPAKTPDGRLDKQTEEQARAALAPTVEATRTILPWLAKPREPRFPQDKAERWQAAVGRLAELWSARHPAGLDGLRPAVFGLYACALELNDGECLHLAEALASAADRLETGDGDLPPRLVAAISAALECLTEKEGLEHPAFSERARHFAERIERCADPTAPPPERSPVIERIFVGDAVECLERMREGLASLPPDPYAIKKAASELARLAEPLELDDIHRQALALARSITIRTGESFDLEADDIRSRVEAAVAELEKAVANPGSK